MKKPHFEITKEQARVTRGAKPFLNREDIKLDSDLSQRNLINTDRGQGGAGNSMDALNQLRELNPEAQVYQRLLDIIERDIKPIEAIERDPCTGSCVSFDNGDLYPTPEKCDCAPDAGHEAETKDDFELIQDTLSYGGTVGRIGDCLKALKRIEAERVRLMECMRDAVSIMPEWMLEQSTMKKHADIIKKARGQS